MVSVVMKVSSWLNNGSHRTQSIVVCKIQLLCWTPGVQHLCSLVRQALVIWECTCQRLFLGWCFLIEHLLLRDLQQVTAILRQQIEGMGDVGDVFDVGLFEAEAVESA